MYKKIIAASRPRDVENMMDKIEDWYSTEEFGQKVENILDNHGASEDDSDPEEGMYATMSDEDIREAYDEIFDLVVNSGGLSTDKIEAKIQYYNKRRSEYGEGYLDAITELVDLYHLDLNI